MITLQEMNPIAAKEWYYPENGEMTPENTAGKSGKEASFQCLNNPKHIWRVKVYSRTINGKNIDCPYCAGRKAFPGESDFLTVCKEAAKMWDYEKNEINPVYELPTSTKRAYFRCENGHSFQKQILNFNKSSYCRECDLQ